MTPDLHTLTGAFAVDSLPVEENESFEAHLSECESCTQEVRELRATAARLGAAAAVRAPAGLRDRVLAKVAVTRQLPPPDLSRHARRSDTRWPLRMLAAAAAILAVLAGGAGWNAYQANSRADQLAAGNRQLAATSSQVAELLTAPDAKVSTAAVTTGGRASVISSAARAKLAVVAAGIRQLSPAQTYQLWYVGDPKNLGDISSVGLASASEGRLVSVVDRAFPPGSAFAISVEPAGGSAQPTVDQIVLAAPIRA